MRESRDFNQSLWIRGDAQGTWEYKGIQGCPEVSKGIKVSRLVHQERVRSAGGYGIQYI